MRRFVALLPVVAVLLPASWVGATWSSAAVGASTIQARSMVNATAFTAACSNRSKNSSVLLTWAASADALVDMYEITRTGSGTGAVSAVMTVSGAGTATWTDTPPTGVGISYFYEIRAASSAIAWKAAALAAPSRPTYDKTSCTAA